MSTVGGADNSPLLEVKDLSVRYGGISALEHVDLTVNAGEVVTLIGANGAGKTTLLRAVSRLVEPHTGSIHFDGTDLRKVGAPKAVSLGIGHSPEGRRVLARQSVRDNLLLGAWTRKDEKAVNADLKAQLERFPRLAERIDQPAGTLSGGEQQMLAIARALMSRPRLLLLDEPSLGLAPRLVRDIFAIVGELHDAGVTILLVEQNATLALQRADRGYVLEAGQMTLSGPAADLVADERVRQAYLG
jgi:branched-chain amino acid transport system ATP-binding protein